ncbi:MAG: hypothetical protein HOO89_07690 [Ferruginibacter sp.]|nr:hypothetical protein [Ferruginibacter sp.]
MENVHIVFWLLKDVSWCMVWKPLGILMIIPTLFFSIKICVQNKHNITETCHNIAITFWICANSYWMISEFLEFDTKPLYYTFTYKDLALIPFMAGIAILGWYYIWRWYNNKNKCH